MARLGPEEAVWHHVTLLTGRALLSRSLSSIMPVVTPGQLLMRRVFLLEIFSQCAREHRLPSLK